MSAVVAWPAPRRVSPLRQYQAALSDAFSRVAHTLDSRPHHANMICELLEGWSMSLGAFLLYPKRDQAMWQAHSTVASEPCGPKARECRRHHKDTLTLTLVPAAVGTRGLCVHPPPNFVYPSQSDTLPLSTCPALSMITKRTACIFSKFTVIFSMASAVDACENKNKRVQMHVCRSPPPPRRTH